MTAKKIDTGTDHLLADIEDGVLTITKIWSLYGKLRTRTFFLPPRCRARNAPLPPKLRRNLAEFFKVNFARVGRVGVQSKTYC